MTELQSVQHLDQDQAGVHGERRRPIERDGRKRRSPTVIARLDPRLSG
jgi:hypothetical protein